MSVYQTNLLKAEQAWAPELPAWVRLLAGACDATNQRVVAERLGKSSGYISRILNRNYAGDYQEAETLVRAAYGEEEVLCPLFGPIPLANCIRSRRRSAPPRNNMHHQFASTCPTCTNNGDRASAAEED